MNDMDRTLCAVTARLLQASRVTAAWGLAISVVAIAMLAFTGCALPMLSLITFAAAALVGVLERYLAFRLYFDAGLFRDLVGGTNAPLDALDSALQRLGLRPVSALPRALEDRVAGARKMLLRHATAVACQTGLLLLALLTQTLR